MTEGPTEEPKRNGGSTEEESATEGSQQETRPETGDDDGGSSHERLGSQSGAPAPRLSGLKNPAAAVRGVGMGTLVLEVIVLLLALQPVRQFSSAGAGVALGVVGALILACVLTMGALRRDWGWRLGLVVQIGIIIAGLVHWSLIVIGALFLAIWIYVLRVRRTVLSS